MLPAGSLPIVFIALPVDRSRSFNSSPPDRACFPFAAKAAGTTSGSALMLDCYTIDTRKIVSPILNPVKNDRTMDKME
jgi:hypothetical protein